MYTPQHERIRRTAEVVADRFLRSLLAGDKTAAWSMDQLARLSILEGAAGKAPGTWLRHKSRGFGSALEFFGPKLQAAWTSATDQGVYDKAVSTAAKALAGVVDMDAMDLVQNLTVNSGRSSGPDRNRIFHSVGKKIQSHKGDLGAGEIGPGDWRVVNTINSWVNNAAKDALKSIRHRRTLTFDPSADPIQRTRGTPELDDEKREALLLLAMQSPGGPGLEVRRIIDRLIDQSFPAAARPIVRVFLEKISQPKYRSADQMRRLVKRFDPRKWFKQALNLVRREMAAEMGLSSQQLTNALGGDAKKVFKFLRERVGKDSRIKGIVADLAGQIELLEPGVTHVANEYEDDEDEREAELTEEQTPQMPHSVLQDWFEKDEHKNWDDQVTPHVQHSRGPVELRVASCWLLGDRVVRARATKDPTFMQWVGQRRFRHPNTGNQVLFVSLPSPEQTRIYQQYKQTQQVQQQQQQPEQKWEGLAREEGKAFKKWLGEQDKSTQEAWGPSAGGAARRKVWEEFKKEQRRTPTVREQLMKQKPPKTDRKLKPTKPGQWGKIDETAHVDDSAQTYGFSDIRGQARIEGKSKVNGTVSGKAVVRDSNVDTGAVRDNAVLERSNVTGGGLVEGNAKVQNAGVHGRNTVVGGRANISNASIRGGRWDDQRVTKSGVWEDSYDQETIDTMEEAFAHGENGEKGYGDLPIRMMAEYMREDGKTKGFFGGDLSREKLLKRVKKTLKKGDRPSLRGFQAQDALQRMQDVDDKAWDTIMTHAKEQSERKESRGRRAALVQHLLRTAARHPELRASIVPLVRLGADARAASGSSTLRGVVIRTAFETSNPALRRALIGAVTEMDRRVAREGLSRQAPVIRTARYRPAFMRWVEGRKFRQPDTGNEVLFVSLPDDEQKRIYAQWQQDRLEWAQRHKPQGLTDETRLTPENFDQVKKDDMVWLSWSPVVLHKVVNIDRSGPRANNPIIEFVQVDPNNPEWRGQTRHMHKSTLQNQAMEAHLVPGVGPRAEREQQRQDRREQALSALPQEPAGGWPKFENVAPLRHGDDAEKAQEVMRSVAQEATDPSKVTFENVRDRLKDAIGHRAGPRAAKEILKEIGKWADELAQAAKDGGPELKAQAKAFRAVRLKVDEALRKADDAIEERSRAVRRLGQGRPMLADDHLQDARRGLPEAAREAFSRDFSEHLRDEWEDPQKGVRELRQIGRRHFGRQFNERIFRDMLLRGWQARASWLDEDGVGAIRDNLGGMTGRVQDEMAQQARRDRRDRQQFPELYELPPAAMSAVRHAIEEGVEQVKGGQQPDQNWLDAVLAKAAEGHEHDLAGMLSSIVGAMANMLKDDMEDAAEHPSENRQSEGATWAPRLKKLQQMAGRAERESERGIFRGPEAPSEPSAPKSKKKKKPKKKKKSEPPPRAPEGSLSREDAMIFADEHASHADVPARVTNRDEYQHWLLDVFFGNENSPYTDVSEDSSDEDHPRRLDEVYNHVNEILHRRQIGADWKPGDEPSYVDPSAADWEEMGRPYVPPHYRGVHEGREELRGKARSNVSGSTRIRPPQDLVNLATPSGLSAGTADAMRRQMRDLTLDGAKDLFKRLNHAIQNPESRYMRGLQRNGYDEGDLKRLRLGLKEHLAPYVGRRYAYHVLAIANNNDLEAEDADALHSFRGGKPYDREGSTDAKDKKIFKKFLAQAEPETRERMRGMRLQDFMDMYDAVTEPDDHDDRL